MLFDMASLHNVLCCNIVDNFVTNEASTFLSISDIWLVSMTIFAMTFKQKYHPWCQGILFHNYSIQYSTVSHNIPTTYNSFKQINVTIETVVTQPRGKYRSGFIWTNKTTSEKMQWSAAFIDCTAYNLLFIHLFTLMGFQAVLQGHMATSSFYCWRRTPHIRISEYSHVLAKPPNHHSSAGRPPRMNVFAQTGTQTHMVRGWVITSGLI